MPFFGGFRSNSSAKRNKSSAPVSSSGISSEHPRNGIVGEGDRPEKEKPKGKNPIRRFFSSASNSARKKRPVWDEDQHRRTSVARSDTFTLKQDAKPNLRTTASIPRDKSAAAARKANGGELPRKRLDGHKHQTEWLVGRSANEITKLITVLFGKHIYCRREEITTTTTTTYTVCDFLEMISRTKQHPPI